MASVSVPDQLSDSRYVTLIVRILVDPAGELVHGDVAGSAGPESTGRWIHFHGASGLLGAVQAAVADTTADTQPNAHERSL